MTTEEIVELVRGTIVDEASPGSDTVAMYYSSPGVLSTIPYESVARAVVAALREAGRLVPEGVTVRYGWQSGDSSPAAWSASRVAVEQP